MTFDAGDPVEGIVANQINDVVRANNVFLVTALEQGHFFTTGSGTGWHKSGAAQMYSGSSAPTTKEDGSTALTSTDFKEKLWVDETTSPGIVNVYTAASTWTPLAQMIGMLDEDDMSSDSAVLPASQQSIKKYTDDGQLLDVKLTGSTMSGVLNMGSNLISAVTDPSSAQDAATKNYVDTKAHSEQKTDTYIGDGGSSKSITGLGFQPDYIMIIPEVTQDTHVKTNNMGATSAQNITTNVKNDDAITSIDSDGFTVGDGTGGGADDNMNKSGENYYWIASKNS